MAGVLTCSPPRLANCAVPPAPAARAAPRGRAGAAAGGREGPALKVEANFGPKMLKLVGKYGFYGNFHRLYNQYV